MKNLELKMQINSVRSFQQKLNELNVEFERKINQKDTYYTVSEGLLKLRVMDDSSELIYYNRHEGADERWSDYDILSVSGKNPEDFLKKVFEIEVVVEKVRLLYMFGNTRIHLDEVKDLGSFLELESVVLESEAEAREEFEKVVQVLELDLSSQLKCSYHDLMLEQN